MIRQVLNISTAHLPQHLGVVGGLDTTPGVTAHATELGFLLWVPDDPHESAQAGADEVPGEVLTIQVRARAVGCDYVLFDAEADEIDGLPVWVWDN